MRPRILLSLLVSVALGLWTATPPCWAGIEQGVAAYKQGDFATALHEFLPLAQHGQATAQFYLGTMYTKGWGVPQDAAEAARWYQRAAAQGVPEAQYNLGVMYVRGAGVAQDLVQGYLWLHRAAAGLPAGARQDQVVQARERVAAQLTADQLARAQELARQ
jgi:TPR repeat protein